MAPGSVDRLMTYEWPGNVRELENTVERALILSRGQSLTFDDFQTPIQLESKKSGAYNAENFIKLDRLMSQHITQALHQTNGRVEGKNGAAALLGMNPGTLRKRMKKLDIAFGRKAAGRYFSEKSCSPSWNGISIKS